MKIYRQIKKGLKFILEKDYRKMILCNMGYYNNLSDEEFLKLKFRLLMGYELDLENPQTFNEKLQWLKLYDRRPIYTTMVDKYLVRDYVAKKIGEQYLIPLLGVWARIEDIDFDMLPDQFVLKCNHNSGAGMYICTNKQTMNRTKVLTALEAGLKQDYYQIGREWPYKNVNRKIIAEKYIVDPNVAKHNELKSFGLIDYKFYCFNGIPKFLYTGYANIIDGKKNDYLSFRNLDWSPAEFGRVDHKAIPFELEKPKQLDRMIEIARILSEDIPFVRVDLYCIGESIYFSEFTFCPGAGYGVFHPVKYEVLFGSWIDIEGINNN